MLIENQRRDAVRFQKTARPGKVDDIVGPKQFFHQGVAIPVISPWFASGMTDMIADAVRKRMEEHWLECGTG